MGRALPTNGGSPGKSFDAPRRHGRIKRDNPPRVVPVETLWPRLVPTCRPCPQVSVTPPWCHSLVVRPLDVQYHGWIGATSGCSRAEM
jgi:hypothetical protein